MSDPFTLVKIDGTRNPVYLPAGYVREQQENLAKAHKLSAGRIFSDYRYLQTGMGPGLEKPPEGLNFDQLRQLADVSPIDRLIIDTRVMQMKRVARRSNAELGPDAIGFAVRHERHNDPHFEVPQGLMDLARKIEDVINSPTAPFHQTTKDFFAAAVEEELTIDRKAMVIARDGRNRPVRFHLIDGATVRPVPVIVFEAIQKETAKQGNVGILGSQLYSDMLYQLSEIHGVDLTDAAYVQMVDGQIVGSWRDNEMSIDIAHPSVRMNSWGYGRSALDRSWRLSQAFLSAWNYNLELFKLNYPEAVLAVIGEYDEEGLKAFKRKVLGEGGQDNNWRLPVIPIEQDAGRLEMVKLRDTPKDMMFAEFLQSIVRLKCAAYRMHPSMINFTQESNGGITFQSNATEEQQIEQSQEEGFHALLDSIAEWLTRVIVKEWHEDLRVVWHGLDQESEESLIQRATQEVQSYLTINEVRKKRGHKKLKPGIPEDPGDFIGSYDQAVQIVSGQQQMQMQQGGDGYDQGDFGSGGDEQQPPWMQQGGQQGDEQGGQQQQPQRPQLPDNQQQPQPGGPQDLKQEAEQLRRSRRADGRRVERYLRIRITE